MTDLSILKFTQNSFLFFNGLLASIFFLIDEPMHMKRGLSQWEKISHIIDAFCTTCTYAIGYLALLTNSSFLFWLYCAFALITICISFKDEWIHANECPPEEHLVHASMFAINGICYVLGAFIILLKLPSWPLSLGVCFGIITVIWQFIFWFFLYKSAVK